MKQSELARRIADLEKQVGGLFRARTNSTIACRVYSDAAQTLTLSGTLYAVAFNLDRQDTHQMHNTATNNSRIYLPIAGWYLVTANVFFANNATGTRGLYMRVDGSTYIAGARYQAPADAALDASVNLSTVWYFSAGNYIELMAVQYSGGALDTRATASYSPELAVVRLG